MEFLPRTQPDPTAQPDRQDLAAALAEFAGVVAEPTTASEIVHRLVEHCCRLLPVDGAGVLLRAPDGHLRFATASDDIGATVEQLEVELEQGPCIDSFHSGRQIIVPDMRAARDRYPRFAPRAVEVGVLSVHALPITARAETVGTIDLIARRPLDLTPEQLSAGQLLGDVAMSYIANSAAFDATARVAEQLQHALDSRVVIEQAKGKLAERLGITVTEAFELLRRAARTRQQKLRDVAEQVLRDEMQLR